MAKQAPASLSSSLLGVPKGAAAPAEITGEGEESQVLAPLPAAVATPPLAVRRPVAPPPSKEPMIALTVRLPEGTQERLREMAHVTRQQKQDILNQALIQFMSENGY